MMDILILPMDNLTAPAVAEIEKSCFQDPWPLQILQQELLNPLAIWLCAQIDNSVVGYVGCQIVPPEADMMNLAVKAQYRRQGIASALLDALISALKARGITSLSLEVRASNEAAIALYGQFGFLQAGRRKNYYYHPTEDAWILKKEWER